MTKHTTAPWQVDGLPWLAPLRSDWQALIQSGRLPHAVLIRGLPGSGKVALAQSLAADLLCEQPAAGRACGQCPGCHLLAAGTHPDYHTVVPDGQFIKVGQIRQISNDLSLSAHRGGHKVALILAAGSMNLAAANALLKTLEEPTPNTCLILVSDESDRLLPTIVSRCRVMPLKPPTASQLASWLGQEDERARRALILAGGAPLQARNWLEDDRLDRFMMFFEQLAALRASATSINPLSLAQQWLETLTPDWLAASYRYLLHLQQVQAGIGRKLSGDRALLTQLNSLFSNTESMARKLKHLSRLRHHLGGALKKELLFEEFLINWKAD